jgi:hypothetical protein
MSFPEYRDLSRKETWYCTDYKIACLAGYLLDN